MKIMKRIGQTVIISALAIGLTTPQWADAAGSTGGSSRGSSSSSSSSSASSSSAARSSSTSSTNSTSMARQSALNASRQSARQASRNASRSASQKGSSASRQRAKASLNRTKSLTPPPRRYQDTTPYHNQFMGTSFYNNWLFYYAIVNNSNAHQKKQSAARSIQHQKDMLRKQMKKGETLHTVTIQTKHGPRLIALPKKDYDKVQKGATVHYHNGKISVES